MPAFGGYQKLINISEQSESSMIPTDFEIALEDDAQDAAMFNSAQLNPEQMIEQIRQAIGASVQRQCDRLRMLGMPQPLNLKDIYIAPQFFTHIPSQRRLRIEELPKVDNSAIFESTKLLTTPALEIAQAHPRLLILGKLGIGKTVLLKYLALVCIAGDFCPDHIPVLISLREFAREFMGEFAKGAASSSYSEFAGISIQIPLAQYIAQQLVNYGVEDSQQCEYLLRQGKLLLLCDELDDVSDFLRHSVLEQINQLADRFPQHQWAIASRSSTYTHQLEQFTTFELAGFDFFQIYTFASKWFKANGGISNQLDELVQIIEQKPILKEFVCNPLILSQICLAFHQGTQFDELEFYREILDILLRDWQATKNLVPDRTPQPLLKISQKKALLEHLAIAALEHPECLWERVELEQEIQIFSLKANLPQTIDPWDWVEMFKTQHGLIQETAKGLFGFSDRALQASLAADKIVASKNPAAIKYLIQHLGDRHGNDVIVMAIGRIKQPEQLLRTIYEYIESLVVDQPQIQKYLAWVNQQVLYLRTPYKPSAVKALYLDFNLETARSLDRARALDIAHSRSLERAQMRAMSMEGETYTNTGLDIDLTVTLALNLDLALFFASHSVLHLASALEPQLGKALAQLRRRLPDPSRDRARFAQWWQARGLEWSKQFREVMIQHRKGKQDWEFSDKEIALLQQYHDANKLLVDCLNACPNLDRAMRERIESSLFLSQITEVSDDDDQTVFQVRE
jgi:hypothetical protein